MQDICSSNPPTVNRICDPNKSWAQHHCSLKLGLKLKYLNLIFHRSSQEEWSLNPNVYSKGTKIRKINNEEGK